MIPKNFSRDNFTPARHASLFHCNVWFGLDQTEPEAYTSWRNELYQVNAKMKVVAHASAFKALKDMVYNFSDPAHRLYRPFTRAEIYENLQGTTLLVHDGKEEIKVTETFKPMFLTAKLKMPGNHRIISHFESLQFGKIEVDRAEVMTHLNNNWNYYHKNFKPVTSVSFYRKGVAA